MLGFDGEYTAGHPKGKFFTFVPETCEKSPLKHFLENLVLLSVVIYLQSLVQECLRKHTFISNIALCEKCPNSVGSDHLNFHSLQILVFQKFHSFLKVTFRTNKFR